MKGTNMRCNIFPYVEGEAVGLPEDSYVCRILDKAHDAHALLVEVWVGKDKIQKWVPSTAMREVP